MKNSDTEPMTGADPSTAFIELRLSNDDIDLLLDVSVLPGSFDLRAAITVTDRALPDVEQWIGRMVEHNLILRRGVSDGRRTYSVDPFIRATAVAHPRARLRSSAAQARYARYCTPRARRIAPGQDLGVPSRRRSNLTPRQWEVAVLVASGRTNEQIGRALGISKWTVVNHLRSIMHRLDCTSRVDVARFVLEGTEGSPGD